MALIEVLSCSGLSGQLHPPPSLLDALQKAVIASATGVELHGVPARSPCLSPLLLALRSLGRGLEAVAEDALAPSSARQQPPRILRGACGLAPLAAALLAHIYQAPPGSRLVASPPAYAEPQAVKALREALAATGARVWSPGRGLIAVEAVAGPRRVVRLPPLTPGYTAALMAAVLAATGGGSLMLPARMRGEARLREGLSYLASSGVDVSEEGRVIRVSQAGPHGRLEASPGPAEAAAVLAVARSCGARTVAVEGIEEAVLPAVAALSGFQLGARGVLEAIEPPRILESSQLPSAAPAAVTIATLFGGTATGLAAATYEALFSPTTYRRMTERLGAVAEAEEAWVRVEEPPPPPSSRPRLSCQGLCPSSCLSLLAYAAKHGGSLEDPEHLLAAFPGLLGLLESLGADIRVRPGGGGR